MHARGGRAKRSNGQSGLGVASFALAAALASTQLAASCVDGVTPDCSDAAVCAPSMGTLGEAGSEDADRGGGLVVPEASTDADVDAADAGQDAKADADAGRG